MKMITAAGSDKEVRILLAVMVMKRPSASSSSGDDRGECDGKRCRIEYKDDDSYDSEKDVKAKT